MKISKLYNLYFVSAVVAIGSLMLTDDVLAAYKKMNRGSVLHSLQKRNELSVSERVKGDKVRKQTFTVEEAPVTTEVEMKTSSSDGWFDFNSGPIFDTGSCALNHRG